MILNNFKKILWGAMTATTHTNTKIIGMSGVSITNGSVPTLGSFSIFNYAGGNIYNVFASTYNEYNNISLTFGSGTTEPTADDYQMESPYDTTDHFSWQSQTQSAVADNLTKIITASIANISDEDLTVSEIGVVIRNSSNYHQTLISRSLITPVTISPNETKTFQYTLDFTGLG